MLKRSPVLFLNCLGSYFYSIVEECSRSDKTSSLIYYLATGSISFRSLSMDDVRQKNGDNPWGYQPVIITNEQGEQLAINNDFFNYLYKEYGIAVCSYDAGAYADTMQSVMRYANKDVYQILTVDEYYLPQSKRFYLNYHNKHSLLMQDFDEKNEKICVVDSEKIDQYKIGFADLSRAIQESIYKSKRHYVVDCREYHSNVKKEELHQRYVLQPKQSDFIDFLLADISEKMHTDQQDYFYKGYYYTILSKIVPYNQMLVYLYDGINRDLYLNAKRVLNAWKSLYRFMLFSMQKNTQDLQMVINKIHSISKLDIGVK